VPPSDASPDSPENIRTSGSQAGPRRLRDLLARLLPRRTQETMPRARRLVIGLGNPGPDYAETRHNVGFLVADAVARRAGVEFEPGRGPYVVAGGNWRGTPFSVAKPAMLYMNQSGTAVRKLLAHFGLTEQDILLAYDDIALDPGQIRLRSGGGAGGHNGVQDVIDKLGTAKFPRLRIGIGSSFPRGHQVDYVLGPFDPEQQPLVEEAVERGAEAALTFARDGLNTAMNRFNRRQESGA
jgi:peptidyl-tRNA hydrolase, PTH1 family